MMRDYFSIHSIKSRLWLVGLSFWWAQSLIFLVILQPIFSVVLLNRFGIFFWGLIFCIFFYDIILLNRASVTLVG